MSENAKKDSPVDSILLGAAHYLRIGREKVLSLPLPRVDADLTYVVHKGDQDEVVFPVRDLAEAYVAGLPGKPGPKVEKVVTLEVIF